MLAASADRIPVPFAYAGATGRWLAVILRGVEYFAGLVLAVDVGVVFVSVIFRYFLHDPIFWAEEVARALMVMQVFFGAATVLGRGRHVGIDSFRALFPKSWTPSLIQMCCWIIVAVSATLFVSSCGLLMDSGGQTTSIGLPQVIYVWLVVIGSFIMTVFGIANALAGPRRTVWTTLIAGIILTAAVSVWNIAFPEQAIRPWLLLLTAFIGGLLIGMPIAFVLAFASLLYFLADPSLPLLVYSQQVLAGMDHFVLLAIPFFVLAGMVMEINGMSSRLIELLLRMLGRLRGGLNLITIAATAFFSGISGSKLADVAAVGGIIMPAVRRTKQDPNDAAGLLAATAVMAETIPPCVNMIILGFVANISIGGLFVAGLVPALVLALALIAVAIAFGTRSAFAEDDLRARTPLLALAGSALVSVGLILIIFVGFRSGFATATEISAFAVLYSLVVGGLVF